MEQRRCVISVLVSKRHCSKNVCAQAEEAGGCIESRRSSGEYEGGRGRRPRSARRTLPPADRQSATVARVGWTICRAIFFFVALGEFPWSLIFTNLNQCAKISECINWSVKWYINVICNGSPWCIVRVYICDTIRSCETLSVVFCVS